MATKRKQQRAVWQPLREGTLDPDYIDTLKRITGRPPRYGARVFANDQYEVILEPERPGVWSLSIKRLDRSPINDWRHLQQIKNEVAGAEAEAVMLFPAESRLVDTSNQFWLFVISDREGIGRDDSGYLSFGFKERTVSTDEQVRAFNAGRARGEHKGRQRSWQPGLTTGRGEDYRKALIEGIARNIKGSHTEWREGGTEAASVESMWHFQAEQLLEFLESLDA